jgi:putative transposase
MARKLRLHIAGMPVHLIQRGNNRCPCFVEDSERLLYLSLLKEAARMHGCGVHAFVLMTNHVHMLASAGDEKAISRMMKRIGESYVRIFNKRHDRTGTLWEGRFRASIVDSRAYFLTCQRYIECNPVRAGMVSAPGDYPWSSFRHNALGQSSDLLTPHAAYLALGETSMQRQERYRALFAVPESTADLDRIRECVNAGLALGDANFIRRVEETTGRRASRKPGGRPPQSSAQSHIAP